MGCSVVGDEEGVVVGLAVGDQEAVGTAVGRMVGVWRAESLQGD